MRLTVAESAPETDLERRYRTGDPVLASRLGGPIADVASFGRAADRAAARPIDRDALVDALRRAQSDYGLSPATEASIAKLADPRAVVVATGQQPGLLTGPAYTVLKAATAVALARRLEESLGRPCVPLFWIASDDHDLPEIEGCNVLSDRAEVRRFRVPLGPDPIPSARVATPAGAADVFAEYLAELPDEAARERVRAIATPVVGERWPRWFGRILARLFESSGLVLFEPHRAPGLVTRHLVRELIAAARAPAALRAGAAHLESVGLKAPLPTDAPSSVFVVDGKKRRRFDPKADSVGDWAARSASDPGSLSGDAGLRAALQSIVFPTVAVVGGVGELSYWMQLPELFAAAGAPQPVFVLRASATIVEPRVRRSLEALGFSDADLFLGEAALRERFAARLSAAADPRTGELRDAALAAFDAFASSLGEPNENIAKRAAELRATFGASLAKLADGAERARLERAGASERRLLLVARSGRPHDQPQDRVLNGLAIAGRVGLDVYDRLAARLDALDPRHRIVHPDLGET